MAYGQNAPSCDPFNTQTKILKLCWCSASTHQMWYIYRVYQKEVNSLKNDSKLKSVKYLVKILF